MAVKAEEGAIFLEARKIEQMLCGRVGRDRIVANIVIARQFSRREVARPALFGQLFTKAMGATIRYGD